MSSSSSSSSSSGSGDISRLPKKWHPAENEYTLYWHAYSQPSRAVAQLFDEGGIPHTRISINLPKKEQKDPLYLEVINPAGLVPVVYKYQEKKFQSESNDIMRDLVRRHKDKIGIWYPVDDIKTTAYIDEQLKFISEKVRPLATGILRDVAVLKNGAEAQKKSEQIPSLIDDIENHFHQAIQQYKATNSEKTEIPSVVYIGGTSHPTIADLQLVHEINSPYHLGVFPFNSSKQPLLTKWYHAISHRPATKKAYGGLSWPIWFASGALKVNGWFGKHTL